jgi:hypothetical protein
MVLDTMAGICSEVYFVEMFEETKRIIRIGFNPPLLQLHNFNLSNY